MLLPVYVGLDVGKVEVLQVPVGRGECDRDAVGASEGGAHLLDERNIVRGIRFSATTVVCLWVFPVNINTTMRSKYSTWDQEESSDRTHPSKPYVDMKLLRLLMKVARLPALLLMSLNAVRVGPGSVKLQPPTEIQVCKPFFLDFKAVKRLYSAPVLPSIGAMAKEDGSKKAKAKLIWVKPSRFSCSGETAWHWRVFDHAS